MEELMKLDLYDLLNISSTAEEKEIKSAYRKKALACHPDKNPDNPKAAELFQQLSKALQVLTDKSARAAYDKVLKARKAAQIRHRELDSKRKKLKEDLEAREKAAQEFDELKSAEKLKKEIERLRKEGSSIVEKEMELLRQQIINENLSVDKEQPTNEDQQPRLKVKWKSAKSEISNGGYNKEDLEKIFEKYGQVNVYPSKKRCTAILEFSSLEAAQRAFELEKGNTDIPLTVSWLSGQPQLPNNARFQSPSTTRGPPPEFGENSVSPLTSRDYESIVLMKLRQAEERKRLIQQMMEEDD